MNIAFNDGVLLNDMPLKSVIFETDECTGNILTRAEWVIIYAD